MRVNEERLDTQLQIQARIEKSNRDYLDKIIAQNMSTQVDECDCCGF